MDYNLYYQEIDQENVMKLILELIENEVQNYKKCMPRKLKISSTRIKQYLDKMRNSGIIRYIGSTKAGYWEIID